VKWQFSTDNWTTPQDIVNTAATYTAVNLTTTTKYRAVLQSGVCSSANSADATVTVDPVTAGGTLGGSTTVCTGTNSTELELTGYVGSIIKWQYSTDNWTTPVDISNTSNTYTATNLIVETKYRVIVTSGVCSSANSSEAVISVDAAAVGGSVTGNATVCSGTNSTELTLAGHTGTISKWQSSTDNWSTSSDISNTTTTYTATNLTQTTRYRAVITNGVCTSNSADATVTVDPVSAGGTLGGSTTVCEGTNSTLLELSGYTGNITKWQYSTDNWTTPVDISNTSNTYSATDLSVETKYRVVVTSGVCSSANSSEAVISVDAAAVGGSVTGDATVCSGTNSTELTLAGYTGTISKWQSSTDNWSTSSDISNSTTTYTAANLTQTTRYRAVITNGVCTSNSADATVTVDPVSAGGTLGGSTTVCEGTNSTLLELSGYTGSITKWQYSTDNWTTPVDISNTSNTYTATDLTVETKYRVVVTSGVCSSANSSEATLTVQSKPLPSNVQISGTLTKGETVTTSYDYNKGACFDEVPASTEIRWYRNSVASGTGTMITMKYATDKTYTLVQADKGNYVRTGIRLSDGSPGLRDEVFGPWVGPVGDNPPTATNVNIVGNPRSGLTVYGTYTYFDADNDPEGTSTFIWYKADNAAGTVNKSAISGATALSYTIDHLLMINKFIGFEVTPVATDGTLTGTPITSPFKGPVENDSPLATSVSVSGLLLQAGQVLNGHYTYSDTENDLESGSTFKWYSSTTSGGTYTATGETGISRVIGLADQGKYYKFSVIPKAASGTTPGAEVVSTTGYGPVNSKPVATGVSISGTVQVDQTLTGNYSVSDPDPADNPTVYATFRWLRTGGIAIPGATGSTYKLTADDEGYNITFEVTPHSTTGYPTTGDIVLSSATGVVPISPTSPKPVASDVCIQGVRATGETLTARYTYTFTRDEGASERKWYRGATEIGTGMTYVLTADDVASTQEITFAVTPKSVATVKTGTTATSSPLARITLTQTTYTETVESVTLTANPAGGVFSGPFVTDGIFSPKDAGADTICTINYLYTIVNTTNTCSQQASKDLTVIDATTAFGSVKSVYCRDDAPDLITVDNLPAGAYPYPYEPYYGFFINTPVATPPAIVPGTEILTPNPYTGSTPWSVTIDPALLNVGNNTLYLYYLDALGYLYLLRATLYVEQVGTITEISNLKTAYCAADLQQSIQVYGLYPAGGTAAWTAPGTLLTDKNQLIAKINPGNVSPGGPYTITYQYTTPNQCKSNILSKNVTINTMPDASFNLEPSYNVEGEPYTLIPSIPFGGSFLGDGISGNKLFPNLAGTGPKNILFKITDANGCYDEETKTTIIRKAKGTISGISSVECYSNTTYNISVTGLPDDPLDVVNILNFKNKKNSIVWTPGTKTAQYNIAAARAGYDTLTFSYTWDGVPYSISHGVYIDSIGKVVITGLKDNYCDYEGTATLRVLVENSTGSGNFSFSGPAEAFSNYGLLADFYPTKAPPSATPYNVSYTHVSTVNSSGCIKTETLPVTVNESPPVSIFNTRTTVNIKEAPLVLNGSPAEGTFSGKGVYKSGDDFVFDPLVAGLGDVEFTLAYTDAKGCLSTVTDNFLVDAASGSILGINSNNQYCYDGLKDTLTYTSSKPWVNGSFSGAGITNTGSAKAVFDPAAAGRGDRDIVFTYYDLYGTVFDVSARVNVDSLGVVEIKNLVAGDEFCNNDAPFELFTTPRGGTFTGPVTTGSLNPSKALGDTAVTYTYLNIRTGCSITDRVPFKIYPAPAVSFVPEDICIENKTDSIRFVNNTTSADSVNSWLWTFSDIGGTDLSSKKTPAYIFKTGGQHLVTLTATTINDCSVKKDLTVDLGIKPEADFYWTNECFVPNDSVFLFDKTVSSTPVISQSWNFFDGAPLKTQKNVSYPKREVGALTVQYIVKTNYANCYDTVTRNIYIRPNIILTADGYFESFEAGEGGWSRGSEADNNWSFGTPDRSTINTAASGEKAWYTAFDIADEPVESSSVISPCFDFTTISRPMIGIKLWRYFDRNRNGASLQYRIGDIGSWQLVGLVDEGINWYNSFNIMGKPGDNPIGWTTTGSPDIKWIEAKHTLDGIQGKKDVKFRIAFGSPGENQYNEGMAFDDIFIGEKTRNVLLEHFANTSSGKSSEATAMIDKITRDYDADIINVQYHTNFPGIDSFYLENPGDVSARILFYGLTRAPYSFVDGGTNEAYANIFPYNTTNADGSLVQIDPNDVTRRSLISPAFDINIDPSNVSGGVLSVSGQITALQDMDKSNLTLYIAVVDKLVDSSYTGASGESKFHNVFRKFVPDAGGINLKKTWIKGDVFSIPEQIWVIQETLNNSDIEVIAFIQNSVTKELYQATSLIEPDVIVSIEKPRKADQIDFALYPNPAEARLTIRFGEMLKSETDIFIYDYSGAIVRTFKAGSGQTEFTIDDLGLRDGIYLIRISSGGVYFGYKKLIIAGS
jgi:nucleoside phosphorylase